MWVKVFRAAAFGAALLATLAAVPAKAAAGDPVAFIQNLGDQAIQILKTVPATDLANRKAQFGKLFTDGFDVPSIGKFVLGRYWRTATPEQQQEYTKAFGDYVVSVYSERFSNYSGEQFKVVGSRTDADASYVTTQINRTNGGPPIHIQWKVEPHDGTFKITDVIVENLSMSVTQRAEFSSIIERGGGNVQALIDMLKQKTAG